MIGGPILAPKGQMTSTPPRLSATLFGAQAVVAAQSVWEYDERFISPRYGFSGAEDYYDLCKPLNFMPEIRVPTLVLAAGDDPWIPSEYYRDFDWATNAALMPLLPESGGHLGFHGSDRLPWSDLALARFFERTCV